MPDKAAPRPPAHPGEVVVEAAPEVSYGFAIVSYAHSLALLMNNAVATQLGGAEIADAAVARACAEILEGGR